MISSEICIFTFKTLTVLLFFCLALENTLHISLKNETQTPSTCNCLFVWEYARVVLDSSRLWGCVFILSESVGMSLYQMLSPVQNKKDSHKSIIMKNWVLVFQSKHCSEIDMSGFQTCQLFFFGGDSAFHWSKSAFIQEKDKATSNIAYADNCEI